MKNLRKLIEYLENTKWGLVILIILHLVSLHLILSPETVNPWVIRGIGVVWLMRGVDFALQLFIKIRYK